MDDHTARDVEVSYSPLTTDAPTEIMQIYEWRKEGQDYYDVIMYLQGQNNPATFTVHQTVLKDFFARNTRVLITGDDVGAFKAALVKNLAPPDFYDATKKFCGDVKQGASLIQGLYSGCKEQLTQEEDSKCLSYLRAFQSNLSSIVITDQAQQNDAKTPQARLENLLEPLFELKKYAQSELSKSRTATPCENRLYLIAKLALALVAAIIAYAVLNHFNMATFIIHGAVSCSVLWPIALTAVVAGAAIYAHHRKNAAELTQFSQQAISKWGLFAPLCKAVIEVAEINPNFADVSKAAAENVQRKVL